MSALISPILQMGIQTSLPGWQASFELLLDPKVPVLIDGTASASLSVPPVQHFFPEAGLDTDSVPVEMLKSGSLREDTFLVCVCGGVFKNCTLFF